jgi:hypothetical protein
MFLFGCSHRPQPKSWVEVVRPPMRVTYIDFAKDIDPNDVHRLSVMMSKMKFHDYQFNNASNLHIDYTGSENLTTVSNHAISIAKE